jgi:hypothetical protein
VTSGAWSVGPTECGPFASLVKANGTATDTLTVKAAASDSTVTTATGDFEKLATSAAAANAALGTYVELSPGQSATVNVTITPAGTAGTVDTGTLYLDALQSGIPPYGQIAADEVAALPYSYTVG